MLEAVTLPYQENPALWDLLLANDPIQYPLGFPSDQTYSHVYAPQWQFQDLSLMVHDKDVPLAGLQITLSTGPEGQQELNFYGRQAYLRLNQKTDRLALEKAQKSLAASFLKLYESLGKPDLNFLEMCIEGNLSHFAIIMLSEGAIANPLYKQIIDLNLPENELRRDLRKSYKSLITWGEKNIALTTYGPQNVTSADMEKFRQIHIKVSGRETKPKAAWERQYQQIVDGESFIILGEIGQELVTSGLFVHSPSFCFYGVSASIREMFDKPLAHIIIWQAIIEAKRRGCRYLELGDLPYLYKDKHTEKENNISIFKRGFGGQARVFLQISFPQ